MQKSRQAALCAVWTPHFSKLLQTSKTVSPNGVNTKASSYHQKQVSTINNNQEGVLRDGGIKASPALRRWYNEKYGKNGGMIPSFSTRPCVPKCPKQNKLEESEIMVLP